MKRIWIGFILFFLAGCAPSQMGGGETVACAQCSPCAPIYLVVTATPVQTSTPAPTQIATFAATPTPTKVPPRTPSATFEPLRCSSFPTAMWVEGGSYRVTRTEFQHIRDGPGTGYAGHGTLTRNAEPVPVYWRITTSQGLWLSIIKDCSEWTAGWLGEFQQNVFGFQ